MCLLANLKIVPLFQSRVEIACMKAFSPDCANETQVGGQPNRPATTVARAMQQVTWTIESVPTPKARHFERASGAADERSVPSDITSKLGFTFQHR